jgi:hypothetical protein
LANSALSLGTHAKLGKGLTPAALTEGMMLVRHVNQSTCIPPTNADVVLNAEFLGGKGTLLH